MKKFILVSIAFAVTTCANAQLTWPAITQTARPWTRWWWQGSAVNKTDLAKAMQKYRDAGLGGLEITPIYGVKGHESEFIEYLSPKWTDMFTFTLSKAEKLGLGIDMATGTGWPFGGPHVTPEDACKNVNLVQYKLAGGQQLQDAVRFIQAPLVRTESGKAPDITTLSYPIATNKNLQAYAFDQVRFEQRLPLQLLMAYSDKGDTLDLTSKVDTAGHLNWTAPQSNWNLYALFMGWHGKMVERAAPGGEGNAIDHFSKAAVERYLDGFTKAFAGKDIHHLRSYFNDSYEVDDARGQSNWTPAFLQAFQQRRGYDLRTQLTALYQKDTEDKNSRVLFDFRETISDLLLENFTRPWHAWAKAQGKLVRNQSHGSPANILDLYAAIDIPETEGTDILRFKFATSAAHVMGKPLASSESATWLDEHFQSSLGDVKLAIDKYFVGGVNHIFFHGTNYSPENEPWPGWLFYAAVHFTPANSFWKDFPALNHYIARCQSFLQQGVSDNDLLVYFPFSDRNSDPGKEMLHHFDGMRGFENTVFNTAAERLLKEGYTFDLISDRQLMQVSTENKLLRTPGQLYKTILLADTRYVPLETLQRLVKLATDGASIIFLKQLPAGPPGLSHLAERQTKFAELLASIHFKENGNVKTAIVGKGQFLMGDDLDALLMAARLHRETMTDQGLEFARRKIGGETVYFISNAGKSSIDGYIPLHVNCKTLAVFDPMQQRAGFAKLQSTKDGVSAYLQLAPGESVILQTRKQPIQTPLFPFTKTNGDEQPLTGKWHVVFISGGPVLPAAADLEKLGSWTNLPDTEAKRFSGTAEYSIHFKKPTGASPAWRLDLGNVGESAEVLLNGKNLGTLLGPQFSTIIPATALKEDNQLVVRVTNGMANRIADLDKRGVVWKKFYNINFPARLPRNRGADGLFTAAGWDPKPSGLMGPVTITPVIFVK